MTTILTPRRKSSLAAEKRMQVQLQEAEEAKENTVNNIKGSLKDKRKVSKLDDSEDYEINESSDYDDDKGSPVLIEDDDIKTFRATSPLQVSKKRKVSTSRGVNGKSDDVKRVHKLLFQDSGLSQNDLARDFPLRRHSLLYHRPLLLDGEAGVTNRSALLEWFDKVSEDRLMPWRKSWIDPNKYDESQKDELRSALERRAYEVWISEIMLQQTRVSVVIDYWNKWMKKWPRIQDVANASSEEVLFAWKGLGYYSRAARIHEAAKLVVNDSKMKGLLPNTTEELQAKVPGIGRYTGGAISAIVFGKPEAMVDGNVFRVLSRQLGLYVNVKTDKRAIDTLWAAADSLVKAVAKDHSSKNKNKETCLTKEEVVSDGPGRWGQALMELGSTVCTPKPDCANCPITKSCRAYAEGYQLAQKAGLINDQSNASSIKDIEDLCTVCEPYEDLTEITNTESVTKKPLKSTKDRQPPLASFSFTSKSKVSSKKEDKPADIKLNVKALEVIAEHAKKFPIKVIKKAVREEETLVCAIQDEEGKFLIHKRPEKGLLAGMWELPSEILPDSNDSTQAKRKKIALQYFDQLMKDEDDKIQSKDIKYEGELDSIPWLFSHLRLTMHVHLFRINGKFNKNHSTKRWATVKEVEGESMGTGMRKCWTLVTEAM